ncbi:MAG: hypothetical protein KF760_10040 [Candidatus Eremiobacteraeota bacterium]|nr:hypothetical protein [Candidatus Eremiobacteraeota bacterium]MCW5871264.1 hypothetical protein [Candidatus Eremiobacteraeota bacterium]
MEITSFRYSVPPVLFYFLSAGMGFLAFGGAASKGGEPFVSFMQVFLGLLLVFWTLSLGLRVSLRLYKEAGILQYSYRFFGGQFRSREISLRQILATGVRYWATKEVHYEPVLALPDGSLLPVGEVQKTWSLTGAGDQEIFRRAKQQADAVARSLGVECLVKEPDTSLTVVNGQAMAIGNSRQTNKLVNTVVMAVAAVVIFTALFLLPR